ncbi:hypothetical protein E2562_017746 [Oryza meyeriana var. granulata]|uniref:Uncharacterized protein n=1 Tax=Oryza meyeriana var. granulata TaxID=110450 RepID=A0A6G1BZG1_9ORYZ|nr:hypothetical protein E2562_017746 [Oryza meyeriana var. granulata]
MFYLFRRHERDATWRVLKVDRTEPTSTAPGFVKFLGPYYMLVITRRKEVDMICGRAVYAVDKSEMITVPASNVGLDSSKS